MREFVERHQFAMYGFAQKLVKRRVDAEEAVQVTWLKVVSHAGEFKFDNSRKFATWLFTILRNTIRDVVRSKVYKQVMSDTLDVGLDDRPTPVQELMDSEERQKANQVVADAINALPEMYRVPLILKVFEELSYDDIAERLELPRGTVGTRIHTAMNRLRDLLLPQ